VVIMGLFAMVLDYGSLTTGWRTSQNVADTAAFAAAEAARTDTIGTITAAAIAAKVNPIIARYGYSSSELTLSYLDSSNSAVAPSAATKVRAQIDHSVATDFAHSLIGGASAQTTETTRAAASVGGGPSNAFYIMGPGMHTVFINSSSTTLSLSGGGFYVNSTDPAAFQVVSGFINVSSPGTITEAGTSACGGCSPSPVTVPAIPDPFANIPVPSLAGPKIADVSLSTGSLTINPGYYDSILVSGGTLTMNPGVYVFSNTFQITGGTVNGSGVMLYFACGGPSLPATCNGAGQNGASLNLSGGTYVIKAATTGAYQGLLIFYDRNNTSALGVSMSSVDDLTGSVYALRSVLTLTGSTNATLFNAALVIADVKVVGSSTLSLNYGGDFQYRKGGASSGTAW